MCYNFVETQFTGRAPIYNPQIVAAGSLAVLYRLQGCVLCVCERRLWDQGRDCVIAVALPVGLGSADDALIAVLVLPGHERGISFLFLCLQFLSSASYNFQCTGLSPLWKFIPKPLIIFIINRIVLFLFQITCC